MAFQETKLQLLTLSHSAVYIVSDSPSQGAGKKNKGTKIGKEEIKLSLFMDNIMVTVEVYQNW